MKYEEYAGREGDIVTGIIQQTDSRYTLLDLGRVEALLPAGRAGPVRALRATAAGSRPTSSRSARPPRARRSSCRAPTPASSSGSSSSRCPRSSTASSRSRPCAREPGHRTKIAVVVERPQRRPGRRVRRRARRARAQVVNELRGEKVDIVPFSDDPPEFVMKALAPAKVREVRIHEDTGIAEVIVPDFQLSLAIGKEGQNARLAARLTGWRVDIKSETQLAEEEAYGDRGVRRGRVGHRPEQRRAGVAAGRGRRGHLRRAVERGRGRGGRSRGRRRGGVWRKR